MTSRNSLSKIGVSFLIAFFAASAYGQSTDDRLKTLEKRIEELESRETEAYGRSIEEKGRVRTFLSDAISFGGFFETAVTGFSGPDTSPQASAHSNILGLNISAQYDEKMRFVAQLLTGLTYTLTNPHNDFRAAAPHRQFATPLFGSLVAQAYSEMLWSELLRVQVGLGYVPFGQAYQEREPVLFLRRGGPQISQASSVTSVGIAHPLWMGLHVHGAKSLGHSNRWGYDLYTFSPTTDTKSIGVGTRTWTVLEEQTTWGLSAQSGSRVGGTYTSVGIDVDRTAPWGGFTFEYARNTMNDGTRLAESAYLEPYYNFSSSGIVGFVTADYLDNPMNATTPGAVSDPIMKWIYGGGLNWLPIPYARFRLGVFTHRYVGTSEFSGSQRRDYDSYELSTGIAF